MCIYFTEAQTRKCSKKKSLFSTTNFEFPKTIHFYRVYDFNMDVNQILHSTAKVIIRTKHKLLKGCLVNELIEELC